MSVRGLWIVSPSYEDKVLYSRVFPTVEARFRRRHKDKYIPIPDNEEFGKTILISVGINKKFPEFIDWRDSCLIESTLPVVPFSTASGSLWPVIVIEHFGLLLCCLPFVEELDVPLLDLPGVTIGCAVLQGISSVLGALQSLPPNQGWSKLPEVDSYLSLSMPLGTPYDTDPTNVKALLSLTTPGPTSSNDKQKVSPWKPLPYQRKSNLGVSVREFVRSYQWGHSFNSSTGYGSLLVKAQLEGLHTDVTLSLDSPKGLSHSLSLKSMLFHPCLHYNTLANPENPKIIKLKFRPPLHPFSLCLYSFEAKEPPVTGIYEIHVSGKTKISTQVTISLKLKLTTKMKNNFEVFEVRLPFPNRAPIQHVNCTPTWGLIQLTEDKRTMVWNLGQSFPAKSLEASLTAEVLFESIKDQIPSSSPNASGSFAQINFIVKDFTLSGCHVNQKSIQISPAMKASIQTDRELRSKDYKIWNRNEEVPFCTEEELFI